MSEDALATRKQRGLDKLDEQMALLVQRVSGAYHKHYFFPMWLEWGYHITPMYGARSWTPRREW